MTFEFFFLLPQREKKNFLGVRFVSHVIRVNENYWKTCINLMFDLLTPGSEKYLWFDKFVCWQNAKRPQSPLRNQFPWPPPYLPSMKIEISRWKDDDNLPSLNFKRRKEFIRSKKIKNMFNEVLLSALIILATYSRLRLRYEAQ